MFAFSLKTTSSSACFSNKDDECFFARRRTTGKTMKRFESIVPRAKKTTKKKRSQDWANYGSFDESYFEDADTMYKPSQMFNTTKAKRKSGAQNVLEILAEERKQRRAQNYVKYEEENWEEEEEEEEEYWEDEEEEVEEEYVNASAPAASAQSTMGSVESKPKPTKPNNPPARRAPPPPPAPKVQSTPKPKPKPKPQPVKNETPEEAKAKATKTLAKWGFQNEDIAEAMKNASDGSTAKQMQIQVLDYLLETAPLENIPQEYLMDAKQKRM
ncbi:unnamed protein product [Bathycoccus prasinos]